MNKSLKKLLTTTLCAMMITMVATAIPAFAASVPEPALESSSSSGSGSRPSSSSSSSSSSGTEYTGEEITPNVQLYDDETLLTEGVDYDLSYENNINVGTATIIVTFKGNYEGTKRVTFQIIAKALTTDDVVFSTIDNITYTGSPITPEPTMTFGDVTLEKDKDYTLSYENNTDAGTATITVTFIGNYSGTASTTFEIVPDVLSADNTRMTTIDNQTYTGSEITPEPTITYGSVTLEKDKDYTLSYDNNINVGTANMSVTFIGNYSGSTSTTFEIVPDVLSSDKVDVTISEGGTEYDSIPAQTYTGKEITPAPTLTYGSTMLEKDKDYTIAYEDNINVGTATVNITFIGNYDGSMTLNFTINPKDVTDDDMISISSIEDQIYTGAEITPKPVITDLSR